jgi:hypothetical protein
MASAVQKIKLSPSRDIPFNKQVSSQSNVRRVKAGVSIEQLAESIAQRTLLQSLSVRVVEASEVPEFTDTMQDRLRAYGLSGEIISWKLRFFVPAYATGPTIPAKVLKRHPVVRIVDRAVA